MLYPALSVETEIEREYVAQEIEDADVGTEPVGARLRQHRFDDGAIFPAGTRCGDVGAINREMQDEEFERGAKTLGGIVAGGVVTGGDAHKQTRQHRELARQDVGDHAALRLDENLVEAAVIPAHLAPGLVENGKTAIIDEHARDRIEPFIAGRAMDAGKTRQPLAVGEDLLDDHVEPAIGGWLFDVDEPLQPPEVLVRIAQAVDVIKSQPVQAALANQAPDQPMHGRKRCGILNSQSGERIDVEEPPIVDFAAGQTPVREPIMLTFEQVVERENGSRSSGLRVIGSQPSLDRRRASGNGGEPGFQLGGLGSGRIVWAAISGRQLQELASRRLVLSLRLRS